MRTYWLVGVLAVLATVPLASAAITGVTASAGPGGAVTLNDAQWDAETYTLSLSETVHAAPASVLGEFLTDVPGDPTVWLCKTVENDTSFAWAAYHIDVVMSQPFTIDDVATMPTWTWSDSPVYQRPDGKWQGSVDFMAGTFVAIGDWGQFDIKMSFDGPVSFTVDQVPIAPEPASLALLMLGGLLLRRKAR